MTAPRRQRKIGLILNLLAGLIVATPGLAGDPAPLVVNTNTGLALAGFASVSFFTHGKPLFGRPELELHANGAIWRFRNEGDRAAFAEHPDRSEERRVGKECRSRWPRYH